jgi:hypothetical protein
METLADALPKEMARVREILGYYKEIGPAGMFGAAMIEQDLRAADAAVMSETWWRCCGRTRRCKRLQGEA